MKKRMLAIAITTTMMLSCVGCGDTHVDNTIHDIETETMTEIVTETEIATETVAEPQNVTAAELAPFIETGVITGVEDIKIQENTEVDLNELVYVDDTIVKSVDIDDSNVDYSKAGMYEVIYTIMFDETALNEYLDNNNVSISFDTDTESDTIIVKTTITVEIVTEAEATDAIANGEETVVMESTKENVKAENQSKANENAVESKPSETKADKSDSKADTNTEKPADTKTDSNANNNSKPTESKPVEQPAQSTETQTDKSENKTDTATKPSQNTEKPAETKPVHTHSYTSKVTKNATCAEKGVKTFTCNCGATYTEDIAKVAHQYTGTVTKAATCNSTGTKTYKCSCGDSYTESISATGHNWKHYDAEYKTVTVTVKEAWDEDQYEGHCICNGCGQDFGSGTAGANAALDHADMDFWDDCENYSVRSVKIGTIHHDAVTEERQELVHEAYDVCTKCGTKK